MPLKQEIYMPSPTGIFIRMSAAERASLRESALERVLNGERTSLSGGGKSGSRNWGMSAEDILFELDYAAEILGEVPARAQKVVQVLNPQYPTVFEPSTITIP